MSKKRLSRKDFEKTVALMRLSPKNREVAKQILLDGRKGKEVAQEVHLSPQAVSGIVNSVWRKFLFLQSPPNDWTTFCVSLPHDEAKQVLERAQCLRANPAEIKDALYDQMGDMTRLFEDMPGYIYWKNTRSEYMGCNKNLARVSGLKDTSDIIGKTDHDFGWGEKDAEQFRRDDQEIMRTGHRQVTEYELPIQRPDGHHMVVRTEKMRYHDKNGKVIGVIGVAIDITDEKLLEKQLKEAKQIAEEANRAKSEFLANMSHDLKTPLTGVIGAAQLLQQMPLVEEAKEFVDGIYDSGNMLLQNIEFLLDYSKEESGKVELRLEPFDLRNLIEKTFSSFTISANEKHIDLLLSYPDEVERLVIGDIHQVRQIILNLFSNAIKFTRQGYVYVNVSSQKTSDEKINVTIKVIDTGIGIPKDKQSIIFERFTRLTPAYQGMYKGLGLGLDIVKKAVDKLNGQIALESLPNQGTTFTCTLTFYRQNISPKLSNWYTHYQQIPILVVDDFLLRGKILADSIGSKSISSITSQNVIQELTNAHADKKPYQIMLIDNNLQYIDALILCETIKNDSRFRDLLIILMSSPLSAAAMEESKEAGIARVFTKPIMPSEIQNKLLYAWNAWFQSSVSIEERLKAYKPRVLIIEPNEMDQEILKVILNKLGAKTDISTIIDSAQNLAETILSYDAVLIGLDNDFNSVINSIKSFRHQEDTKNPMVILGLVNIRTPIDNKKCKEAGFNQIVEKPIDPDLLKQILCDQLLRTT